MIYLFYAASSSYPNSRVQSPGPSGSCGPRGSVSRDTIDYSVRYEVDDSNNPYLADTAALTSNIATWSWERVLCSDPELLLRQTSRMSDSFANNSLAVKHRLLDEKQQKESLKNPTPAMREIMKKTEEREKEREQMTWRQQLELFSNRGSIEERNKNRGSTSKVKGELWDLRPNLLTPAMEEVIRKRSNRVSVEFDVPITPEPSDSNGETSDDDSFLHDDQIGTKKIETDIESKLKGPSDVEDEDEIFQTYENDFLSDASEYSSDSEYGQEDKYETESYINSSDEEDCTPLMKIDNNLTEVNLPLQRDVSSSEEEVKPIGVSR